MSLGNKITIEILAPSALDERSFKENPDTGKFSIIRPSGMVTDLYYDSAEKKLKWTIPGTVDGQDAKVGSMLVEPIIAEAIAEAKKEAAKVAGNTKPAVAANLNDIRLKINNNQIYLYDNNDPMRTITSVDLNTVIGKVLDGAFSTTQVSVGSVITFTKRDNESVFDIRINKKALDFTHFKDPKGNILGYLVKPD